MRNLHQEVSERIAHQLEIGALPWVKPWRALPGATHIPQNAVTKRPYSGCNVVLLWIAQQDRGWDNARFLTFKQALSVGGCVRKGEHGTKVYFVKKLRVQDKRSDDPKAERDIMMLREYTVFNVAQCDNLPEQIVCGASVSAVERNPQARDATVDAFIAATKAEIREGNGEAFYRSSEDFISLPAFERFKGADHFYATAFHELGHWTGHKSRLDRKLGNRFGSAEYAAEELVAELTSAFLCAEFSFDGELRHAGYIQNWITLLRDDNRAFFTACAAAQKAADYLRGTALTEEEAA